MSLSFSLELPEKNYNIFESPASGKENVQFPDSPDFENLPDLRTGRALVDKTWGKCRANENLDKEAELTKVLSQSLQFVGLCFALMCWHSFV